MKKTLLIALLLIPFLGFSQTTKPIDSFLGIKFGTSRVAVIAALKAKGGILDAKDSEANLVVFKKINLGHRSAGMFIVKLIDNKAFEADFIFDPGEEAHTFEYYYSLVNDINENYGTGESSKTFKEPYNDEDEDNIKLNAIEHGNASYSTFWQSENKNTIAVKIEESLTVILIYQDAVLTHEAVKKQKAKEKSDF